MYICEKCHERFIKPIKTIFHDSIITINRCICPNCGSPFIIENIKKLKGYGDMKKWLKLKKKDIKTNT